MSRFRRFVNCLGIISGILLLGAGISFGQTREEKVRGDKARFDSDGTWVYNDFARGLKESQETGKPLFITFRCIPCEACSEFDTLVVSEQSAIRDLLPKFVCVRVIQTNGLDLSLFQFDFDQSFHAIVMAPDKTIIARFGTRSQREEVEDMTIEGLRALLLASLDINEHLDEHRAELKGKQALPSPVPSPEEYPALKGRYGKKLDYEGQVVRSCIHCHQVRDAERQLARSTGKPMAESLIYPYPLPDVLGLRMEPEALATIADVADKSWSQAAGLKAGDEILQANGQSILSTADLQWVLQHLGSPADLKLTVKRDGKELPIVVALPKGWRATGDISWRPTTWEFRRMALGGMRLDVVPAGDRAALGLKPDQLALKARHVGQYDKHAIAKNAGFVKDDIIVKINDRTEPWTESQFIAWSLSQPPGTEITAEVVRGKEHKTFRFKTTE